MRDAQVAFMRFYRTHTIENRTLREMFVWGYVTAILEPIRRRRVEA